MDRVVPAVLMGGVIGAVARWTIGEAGWSTSVDLVVVNTIGCLVLGAVVQRWPDRDDPTRLALGVGVCGGLTTFAGLAVAVAERLDDGQVSNAVLLVGVSLAAGLLAFRSGQRSVA